MVIVARIHLDSSLWPEKSLALTKPLGCTESGLNIGVYFVHDIRAIWGYDKEA